MLSADEIASRREHILSRIARAAERRGRDPQDVTLLAATKSQSAAVVRNAARAGLIQFGENRVGEGVAKIQAVGEDFPQLVWKLIGPLQTNKAKPALQYFSVVESLDRERLAARLEGLLASQEKSLPVLLEVNLAGEATKSGALPEAAPELARSILACRHLDLRGLMCVPPETEDPEGARPYFRQLAGIRDALAARFDRPLPELSMGMSHDFEIAVEEGSTQVRIGTALFGERHAP
jgi:PLP dependent protein